MKLYRTIAGMDNDADKVRAKEAFDLIIRLHGDDYPELLDKVELLDSIIASFEHVEINID